MQHSVAMKAPAATAQAKVVNVVRADPYSMTDALEALQVHASGLRCWYNGEAFCVAHDEEEARQQLRETLGIVTHEELEADGWRVLALDGVLAVRSDPAAPWRQKETWRWIKDFGPGWLGSCVRS